MKDVELDIQILDPLQCDIEPHLDAKNHIRNECSSSFSNGPLKGRNKEQEQEILNWIEAVIGEKLPAGAYEDVLRDGVILCRLINKIAPGSVNKIQTSGGSFKLMENIQRYITNKIIKKKKKKEKDKVERKHAGTKIQRRMTAQFIDVALPNLMNRFIFKTI